MRDMTRSLTRAYVVGGIWLIVMLATVAALFAPLDAIYVAVGADPVVRTAITMTIAILTATVVATLAWSLTRRWVNVSPTPSPSRDESAETALATFR